MDSIFREQIGLRQIVADAWAVCQLVCRLDRESK
ncbi:hypothetical protein ANO14919_041070 [Xylariales sp. No.14919]|nr:hypothetical protein ANO14919_041070 [Xylariales sp. No.14919]